MYACCKERSPADNTNLPHRVEEIYYTQALIKKLFTHACQIKHVTIRR